MAISTDSLTDYSKRDVYIRASNLSYLYFRNKPVDTVYTHIDCEQGIKWARIKFVDGSQLKMDSSVLSQGFRMKLETKLSIREENQLKQLLGISLTIYGDGNHDDTIAFQALIDGSREVYFSDGSQCNRKVGRNYAVLNSREGFRNSIEVPNFDTTKPKEEIPYVRRGEKIDNPLIVSKGTYKISSPIILK